MRKPATILILLLCCAIFYGLGRPQAQAPEPVSQSDRGALPAREEEQDVVAAAGMAPLEKADVSLPLSGLVIVVDPGHGGYDQGCEGVGGSTEAPVNLAVSLLLREELIRYGARVSLTRQEDASLVDPNAPGNRKKQDMALRRAIVEEAGAHMVLSIHMNYNANKAYSGPQVYYRKDCAQGQALSACIQDAFLNLAPNNHRRQSVGDFYMLNIRDASALVECGFLSNPAEEKLLLSSEYQQQVAQTIAEGVVAYWAGGQEASVFFPLEMRFRGRDFLRPLPCRVQKLLPQNRAFNRAGTLELRPPSTVKFYHSLIDTAYSSVIINSSVAKLVM